MERCEVVADTSERLPLRPRTVCIHGDGRQAERVTTSVARPLHRD